MKVDVYVGQLKFKIPCGDGEQKFRWLGMVAAQRYALMVPHGKCRTREDSHAKLGFYIPVQIQKMGRSNQIMHPYDVIKESCKDGDELRVILQHEMAVDDSGTPQLTQWAIDAFCHTEAAKPRYLRTSTPTSLENDFASEILPEKDTHDRDNKEMARLAMMGHLETEEEIETALNFDWENIKIEDLERDLREQDHIKHILVDYFTIIHNVFQHYSGTASVHEYSMSFMEFAHFIHEAGIFFLDKDMAILEKIFIATNVQKLVDENNPLRALKRYEFTEALIRAAIAKHRISGLDDMSTSEMVTRLMNDYVKPRAKRLTDGPVKELLHSNPIKALFQEVKVKLSKVFRQYANRNNREKSVYERGTLCIEDFISLIHDTGLLCDGPPAENDEIVHQALKSSCVVTVSDGQEMIWPLVYTEFLEAISRISTTKWAKEKMTATEKIGIALDVICMMTKRPGSGK